MVCLSKVGLVTDENISLEISPEISLKILVALQFLLSTHPVQCGSHFTVKPGSHYRHHNVTTYTCMQQTSFSSFFKVSAMTGKVALFT